MNDKTEYKGRWWLPEKPEEQISGEIKFNVNEGTTLELDGAFEDYFIKTSYQINIVLGRLTDGRRVTLYKCIITSLKISTYKTSKLHAKYFFEGFHFEKPEDLIFNEFDIGSA